MQLLILYIWLFTLDNIIVIQLINSTEFTLHFFLPKTSLKKSVQVLEEPRKSFKKHASPLNRTEEHLNVILFLKIKEIEHLLKINKQA